MRAMSTTDDDVLARLRTATRGERDALFEEIFRAHRGRVFALCQRLCGDRALAEDALQETFLAVHRGLAGFRGEAQLGTWIYRIAMRVALRVRANHPVPVGTEVEVAGRAPHDALDARDRARRVQLAIDALPAEQRVVIALFAVEGLSHGEIAAILGVPEGTVWSRLHKARKALATSAP